MRPNFVKTVKMRPDFKTFKLSTMELQGVGEKFVLDRFPSKQTYPIL